MISVRAGIRVLTRNPAITLMVLIVLAVVAYAAYVAIRGRRECMGGDCSEAWANCPVGNGYCYWGDKPYNKGKCCKASWSTDCKVPEKGSAAAVLLYKDSDYGGGTPRWYRVGDYPDLGDMADEASSLKVPSNLKVILYQKKNFEGNELPLAAGDYPNLKHFKFRQGASDNGKDYGFNVCEDSNNTDCWNDSASSMKVMKA